MMEARSRILLLSALFVAGAGVVLFTLAASSDAHARSDTIEEKPPVRAAASTDRALAKYQRELLELAFDAATAMPIQPHVKNRSRAQDAVVAACIELDQPQRAVACTERIVGWRRGACYADIAYHLARRGDTAADTIEVERLLDLAHKVAEAAETAGAEEGTGQAWRRDRIRAKIARTLVLLGKDEQAAPIEASLIDSEAAAVAAVRALRMSADGFDEHLDGLDRVAASGSFDQLRNALESSAQLFDRFYDDVDKRTRVEEKLKASWQKLPIQIRIDLLINLAGFALEHGDRAKALELAEETRAVVDSSKWSVEDRIPLEARIAALRHRAGDVEKARAQADAALAMFDGRRDEIVNIYRAGALRPLAETYQAIGDSASAHAVYAKAVEAGVENPNSRPRAEDLSATCLSMAVHAVEPDAELRARLREIRSKLGTPW